jgi:hypothetical protein
MNFLILLRLISGFKLSIPQHSPVMLQCSDMKYVVFCEDYSLLGCDAVFSD